MQKNIMAKKIIAKKMVNFLDNFILLHFFGKIISSNFFFSLLKYVNINTVPTATGQVFA